MPQYAKNTSVSLEMSRLEIEKILIRYGAANFAYATSAGQALIGFTMCGRQVKFVLPRDDTPREERLAKYGFAIKEKAFVLWEVRCKIRAVNEREGYDG